MPETAKIYRQTNIMSPLVSTMERLSLLSVPEEPKILPGSSLKLNKCPHRKGALKTRRIQPAAPSNKQLCAHLSNSLHQSADIETHNRVIETLSQQLTSVDLDRVDALEISHQKKETPVDVGCQPPSPLPQKITFEFQVPKTLFRLLLGNRGAFINTIKIQAGASLTFKDLDQDTKIGRLKGLRNEIDAALLMIKAKFPLKSYTKLSTRTLRPRFQKRKLYNLKLKKKEKF